MIVLNFARVQNLTFNICCGFPPSKHWFPTAKFSDFNSLENSTKCSFIYQQCDSYLTAQGHKMLLSWLLLMSLAIAYQAYHSAPKQIASCSTLKENIFGECLKIKHLSKDLESTKKLLELTPLHASFYSIVRRFLTSVAQVISRCLFVCTPVVFLASLLCLVLSFRRATHAPKRMNKKVTEIVANINKISPKHTHCYWRSYNLSLICFVLSSTIIVSIGILLFYELNYGGALSYQLSSFEAAKTRGHWQPFPFFFKLFDRKDTSTTLPRCFSVFGLYDFRCLREALFDVRGSGIGQALTNSPKTLHDKLCLQLHLANLNWTTLLVLFLLYATTIGIAGLVILLPMKFIWYCLKWATCATRISPRKWNRYLQTRLEKPAEHCVEKRLKPGSRAPWGEMSFSVAAQKAAPRSSRPPPITPAASKSAYRSKKQLRAPSVAPNPTPSRNPAPPKDDEDPHLERETYRTVTTTTMEAQTFDAPKETVLPGRREPSGNPGRASVGTYACFDPGNAVCSHRWTRRPESRTAITNGVSRLRYLGRDVTEYY